MNQKLTRQQNKIVELLAAGYSTLEIADELKISYRTVKQHIYTIMKRLAARDRTEVVVMYYQEKLKEMGNSVGRMEQFGKRNSRTRL